MLLKDKRLRGQKRVTRSKRSNDLARSRLFNVYRIQCRVGMTNQRGDKRYSDPDLDRITRLQPFVLTYQRLMTPSLVFRPI